MVVLAWSASNEGSFEVNFLMILICYRSFAIEVSSLDENVRELKKGTLIHRQP